MPAPEVKQPIINSPYDEPKRHWRIHEHDPAEKVDGRRMATYMYLPPGRHHNVERERETGYEVELQLVSRLREQVAEWRSLALRGEGGVSRVTMELLNYWRRAGREHRLFFAQLEAAETIIFLSEARPDLLQGIDIPLDRPGQEKLKDGFSAFERRCCRMATGSGKTTVMAMLAAWSILNKVNSPQDRRYSDAVLVVCPNVTIRDRLAELNPKRGEVSIYWTRDLVPPEMRSQLMRGKVLTTNWHVFEPHSSQKDGKVVKAGRHILTKDTITIGNKTNTVRGKRYMTEASLREKQMLNMIRTIPGSEVIDKDGNLKKVDVEEEKWVESDAAMVRRILERDLGGRSNLLVFNDEAHHAYRIGSGADDTGDLFDDDEILENQQKEATTVWVDGLDRIHKLRGINMCVDFSATPYFLAKAGDNTNRIFPWTVSSFDLQDAIEAGLVKIPQLAVRDSSGTSVPGYFNIWRWILPRLTAAERGGKKSEARPEAILKHAHTPIELLGGEWDDLRQKMAKEKEDPRPPVFIIVCKTQKLADTVYRWLGEGVSPSAAIPESALESLRNSDGEENTILVHSNVQKEIDSGNAKDDEKRWMRFTLDTIGKLEWPRDSQQREQYPEGFEELANKLGRPLHPPGKNVRCIVSVGMLTEGWDCNTVTHIIGLRPFMSQLLCEQVIGRGLRRISYDVGEDGLMSEEVATVLGVPLSAFTVKATGAVKPPQKRHHIHAVDSRRHLEIKFPRVEGYRQAVRNRITCDLDKVATVTIDEGKIPNEIETKAALSDNTGRLSLHGPGKVGQVDLKRFRDEKRLQERIFEMTAALTRHYLGDSGCTLPPNTAFNQLYNIVESYVERKVIATAPSDKRDAFLSPYYGYIIERLFQGIRPDTDAGETPELPRYELMRSDGSTADVDFWTSRELSPIKKSHLNAVVADTKRLEQAAAWHLDKHDRVFSFAKNERMGFAIPYLHNGERHEYLPDFVIRLEGDEERYLILETKGYDELKEVKRSAAERWVAAVNADGKYGRWEYVMVSHRNEIDDAVTAAFPTPP